MAERQTETLTDRCSQTFTIEIASSQFEIRTLLSTSNLQGQEHLIGYHRVIQNQTVRKAVIATVNVIKLFFYVFANEPNKPVFVPDRPFWPGIMLAG